MCDSVTNGWFDTGTYELIRDDDDEEEIEKSEVVVVCEGAHTTCV